MDLLQRLRAVVEQQSAEAELPVWLAVQVLEIVETPQQYRGQDAGIEALIEQLEAYSPYAGAGCFDGSVSAEAIGKTLAQLRGDVK
jgi:hypothetical protein